MSKHDAVLRELKQVAKRQDIEIHGKLFIEGDRLNISVSPTFAEVYDENESTTIISVRAG